MAKTEEIVEKEEAGNFGKALDASLESIRKSLEGDPADIPLRLY